MKRCDCLNDCGDDNNIRNGKAAPCQHYLDRQVRAKAARYLQYQVLKAEFDNPEET